MSAGPDQVSAHTRTLRSMGRIVTWLLAGVCAVCAVLRFTGLDLPWPGVVLLAGTPWLIAASLVASGTAAVTRNRWAAVAATATMLSVAILVLPRGWGSTGHGDGVEFRVMTANLRVGGADPATIVRLIRDNRVDVVAVQEYTPEAQAGLNRAGLGTLLPFRIDDAEPLAAGSAIYSRFPLVEGRAPVGPGGFVQATATVEVPGAVRMAVRSVHPCAPYSPAHQQCWRHGLGQEPRADRDQSPVRLLMGDFNATLDHPELRRLIGSGYRDAADTVGAALQPTWPNDLVPVMTLDHVLADSRIGVRKVSVHSVPNSDHRALVAVLTLPRSS